MTITLPIENQRWPQFRLLSRNAYEGSTSSGGNWESRPLENAQDNVFGLILVNYSRALLPQLGTATLIYRYGLFNGRIQGASSDAQARLKSGSTWSPETDKMGEVPDLRGKELLIQKNYPNEDGSLSDGNWSTVFWGTCEYQLDQTRAAAEIPGGEMVYHIVDAFHRTQRWHLNRHSFISNGVVVTPAAGHPGYNVDLRAPGHVAGNRNTSPSNDWSPTSDSSGIYGTHFMHPGAGDKWTDLQALEDVLAIARPDNQPYWTVIGATDLLSEAGAWEIENNETVFSVVSRIFSRGRGRGAALPDWEQSSPTGPITPKLKVFAQLQETVTYTDPEQGGGEVSYSGATDNETVVDVDLIGDHRVRSLQLGDAEQYRVDYLEVQGERIEIMVTLEHGVSLTEGWTATDESDFIALDAEKRIGGQFAHVYTMHRLKRGFALSVNDGNGGPTVSADYRCAPDGSIVTAGDSTVGKSAMSVLELMDDLPFFEGHIIDIVGGYNAMVRRDSSTAAAYHGTPQRSSMKVFIRTNDDLYLNHSQLSSGPQLINHVDGIHLIITDDLATGNRFIGDTTNVSSVYNYEDVRFTVAFRSPHRARIAYGDSAGARKKIITLRNAHLWLLAPNAIYDLDFESEDADTSGPGMRAGGSNPVVIRDDRNMIAAKAALALAWYGPVKKIASGAAQHRGAQWTIACCGDVPTAADYDGGGVVYPTCGQVVQYLYGNGQKYTINSPVSSIVYDNTVGHTTWVCDWQDLDL